MDQQASIDFVKKYIEDILSFFEVNVGVDIEFSDGAISVTVPSTEQNSLLIGRNAETLRSLQYLLSTALRNQGSVVDRVHLDIADYKKQREERIAEQARGWIESVQATGDSYVASLNAADRRVVHNIATEYPDIRTFSEGEGRDRKLIIAQKSS